MTFQNFMLSLGVVGLLLAQRVGIGTSSPAPRAILHLESDSMGFLPPRLTQTERDAIPVSQRTPGLLIYNKTTNCMEFWNGSQWVSMCSGTAPCPPNPPQTITVTSNAPLCEGGTLNLSAPEFSGVNYIWTGPGNFFATGRSVSRSPVQAAHSGQYCVKIYSGSCLFAEGCVNVTVLPTQVVEQKAVFPGGRRGNASAFVIGDSLYVIQGGSFPDTWLNALQDCYAYDVINDQWRQIAHPPTTRTIRAAFEIGRRGYIVGGHPSWANDCYSYNPDNNSWSSCASYPVGVADMSSRHAVGVGGYGYVLGGKSNPNGCFRNEIRRYDPVTNSWSTVGYLEGNQSSQGRAQMFVFEIGGEIYYGAGARWDCAPSFNFSSVFRFNPQTGVTTPRSNAPFAGMTSAYCSLGGYGYVWNGGLWRYDPTTDTWMRVCISLPASPDIMLAHGGKIYFINTSSDNASQRRVYVWQP